MSENNPSITDFEGIAWRQKALEILSELSHSLRNPFSTIQSYLNILEMEEYRFSPEELKEITMILKETVEKSFLHIDAKIAELKEGLKE
jgi:signal transduction histidine kinase